MSDPALDETLGSVAIIGMSGRFPGAANVAEFWENLRNGVESISHFSGEVLQAAGMDPSLLDDPAYVNANGVMADADLFDAGFFGYTPREAETLDPQHRVFLECAWAALEDAGYDPRQHAGPIGVYGGVSQSTYLALLESHPELRAVAGGMQILIGNDKDHLTTRVAYKLDLKGPAITVQTTCSTSLVAVCLAVQSLLQHQCDMALAGGVSVNCPQETGYFYQEGGVVSPDGHCRAFDAQAQGTVGGNGVGIVVLKRLADALADGDAIRAVIRGAAMNNDGSHKVGYTAPSVDGQAEVIALAQAIAGVDPATVTYVEAHGTGTALGDPIEVAALTQAFNSGTEQRQFCALGSVKTNIGHLDAASGVASLIKTTLALQHRELPPSLHYSRPNPKIDFAASPFYVNATLAPWQTGATPRRAGVSSFGMGGTNAHVVLEEAPSAAQSDPSQDLQPVLISARTAPELEAATARLAAHLADHPETDLPDIAYTLALGRRAFAVRRAVVCSSVAQAAAALGARDPAEVLTAVAPVQEPEVIFMFPGQGTQHPGMLRGLYESEPVFRATVDRCAEVLHPWLGRDLRQTLFPGPGDVVAAGRDLDQTSITQPALFTVEYALARLWMAWGVRPSAMIGHSIGEYVAACIAGVFSLEDALALVAERGRLMQALPPGAMLAVARGEDALADSMNASVSLAAVNSPTQCVLSGPAASVTALEAELSASGCAVRRLATSHAFHSSMMDPVLDAFAERVARVSAHPPLVPFISNVTGTWITDAQALDAAYWTRHLRETVRFGAGVQTLLQAPNRVVLEVGPGQSLSGLVRSHPACATERVVRSE